MLYHYYTTSVDDEMFLNAVIKCVTKHGSPFNIENFDGIVTLSRYQLCKLILNPALSNISVSNWEKMHTKISTRFGLLIRPKDSLTLYQR